MRENILRYQRRFMCYNLIAFTLIFTCFGTIVFGQVQASLFEPVDDDLRQTKEFVEHIPGFVTDQIEFQFEPPGPREEKGTSPEGIEPEFERKMRVRASIPMRIQSIVRNAQGVIVNPHVLGRVYWEALLNGIPFEEGQLDRITTFQLEDGSTYRSIMFETADEMGEAYYVQLIVNVDGELAIIDNFFRILVVCVVVFVLLSITASLILSKKTMTPIVKAWNRQTEFVENASHELRTPLTIIQNKLETLLTVPQATVLDKADDIVVSLSETRRLSKLTSDLMTLARADSSETQVQMEAFPLDDLIRKVCEPYGELGEMQEKQLVLELSYGADLTADKGRIHELMVILLDNALKYTREGDRITVRTAQREGRAVIEVADTGIGIKEESRERIFDRFYREDKARSREKGGTGLGLSIAKWIVGVHGGSIRAYPNQPRGSVFQIKL